MKILVLFSALFILFSCKRDAPASTPTPTIPLVVTGRITSVASDSAFTVSHVSTDGGDAVTARGICWSTVASPDTSVSHTVNGTGTGVFTSKITGLTPSTTYYFRAYAKNSVGIAYGADVSFMTMP